MTTLPKRQREIVQTGRIRRLERASGAQRLGNSHATARWHLHEARNALRRQLHSLDPSFC
jgi:DNA-directed RNA polymerase specialized sigma24 family protein